ncbi:MAG: patatin family protein [Clostridia bacterium]|nr:patatin family protein [Clostridia bacterium]
MAAKPKFGLALGAGATRGLAHLGVLQVFQEHGLQFDCIAGTSVGAIFGALYAAGNDFNKLEKLASQLKEGQLLDLAVPRWGLIRGDRIEALVRVLTRGLTFSELKVPFYVVAVDIEKGELVVINKGRVADAVRASIAIPGIFTPKRLDRRLLVDGAVLAPLPVEVLRQHGAEVVVAVDVSYTVAKKEVEKISNLFELLFHSLSLTGKAITCRSLEQADLVIRPAVGHLNPARLHRAVECIELGRQAALEALPQLENLFSRRKTN